MPKKNKRKRQFRRRTRLTPDMFAMIPKWLDLGATPTEVAAALGTSPGSLEVMCSRRGISLRAPRGGTLVRAMQEDLPPQVVNALRREALARGVPVAQLIISAVCSLVDHDLFSAVLGDYDDLTESPPCVAQ